MVSSEKIVDKLGQIDEYLGILKEVLKTPVEVFLNDKMLTGGSKYYLQVSIE